MRILGSALACSLLATTAIGCSTSTPEEDLVAVDDNKADDYYSNIAAEYEVSGTVKVKMTDAEYADAVKRKAIVERRLTAVGLYLTAFVTEKFRGLDINDNGVIEESEVFFRNEDYGGFHAMVRTQSGETRNLKKVSDGVYDLELEIDLAGPKNLTEFLPRAGTSVPFTFELKMPEYATVDATNVPRGEIRAWKPETATGPIETHALALELLPTPKNAYPQYAEFTKDGVYDITMVYGYDYNTPRSDVQEMQEAFEHLVDRGFKAPVGAFAQLKADSGPFVLETTAGGKDVKIEVRLFYADMFEGQRPAQKQLIIDELVKRDVFFYNGHAGPYYGFYVDKDKAASVGYLELATAPFTDKQQLVVAQGCQTYSQYADMIYASPVKSEANLDVITTVNYSYGIGTLELFDSLTAQYYLPGVDVDKNLAPKDAYTIIEQLNAQWYNQQNEVYYGMMGITANPAVHPYAALDKIGDDCSAASDCGDPDANLCILRAAGDAQKVCAAKAVSDNCPTGTFFKQLRQGETIVASGCVN
jgi:hypothetical protein